jgi:hypothetical protein
VTLRVAVVDADVLYSIERTEAHAIAHLTGDPLCHFRHLRGTSAGALSADVAVMCGHEG